MSAASLSSSPANRRASRPSAKSDRATRAGDSDLHLDIDDRAWRDRVRPPRLSWQRRATGFRGLQPDRIVRARRDGITPARGKPPLVANKVAQEPLLRRCAGDSAGDRVLNQNVGGADRLVAQQCNRDPRLVVCEVRWRRRLLRAGWTEAETLEDAVHAGTAAGYDHGREDRPRPSHPVFQVQRLGAGVDADQLA